MGFFGKDNLSEGESGNWNTAENYSKLKIMNLLAICDEYEEMAEFGSLSLIEEITNKNLVEEVKIRAFRRLVNHLIRICNNSYFALKEAERYKLRSLTSELKTIRENISLLIIVTTDRIHNTTTIRLTPSYPERLERVSEIKRDINISLNEGDLIFIHKENFNPKDYKKGIFEDAINRG